MEFSECLAGRKSIRAFSAKEVTREILEKILEAAKRSPSYMNTQPWEVFVAYGDRKEALAKRLYEEAASGTTPNPDLPFPKEWPETINRRSMEHRLRRFKALGIDPNDQEKVRQGYLRNFQLYGAPCVLFIGLERSLTPWSIFDLGLFTGSLLLAVHNEGLGAVPQALTMAYPDIIRGELGIPSNISLLLSVSMGYPDLEAPVNRYRSTRKGQDEYVRWHTD
ncbi:MAG: nitroreductase [Syntrophorhabdales bacterium]|jgi:nitroreductase